ncbi:MAG: hypothetical protein LBT38_10850, partial [Deltaproteobacteria bacterium]|nr:hypothetical protein [Deltaproteobacteria bacterium]
MSHPAELDQLLASVKRLAQEASPERRPDHSFFGEEDLPKDQWSAKNQSRVAIKLLNARSLLEKMAALESGGPTLLAAQHLLLAQVDANLTIEARFIYDQYLKNQESFKLDPQRALLIQFELALALARDQDPRPAEEILAEMSPPEGDLARIRLYGALYYFFLKRFSS